MILQGGGTGAPPASGRAHRRAPRPCANQVYKRYASLYFVCGVDPADNELLVLETIHHFVETLDRWGCVCVCVGGAREGGKRGGGGSVAVSRFVEPLGR